MQLLADFSETVFVFYSILYLTIEDRTVFKNEMQ